MEIMEAPGINEVAGKPQQTAGNNPDRRPPRPFGEEIKEEPTRATALEVRAAVDDVGINKARGPDLLLAVFSKKMARLREYLGNLMHLILRKGEIPPGFCALFLVPMLKPRGDPELRESRGPISLLNTVVKILETISYARKIRGAEGRSDPHKYAYRRSRGTQQHLNELLDFTTRGLATGKWVYVVSLDVKGFFDTVPHKRRTMAL